MRTTIEVKTFKQLENVLERISEATGVDLDPVAALAYRKRLTESVARVVNDYMKVEDEENIAGIERSYEERAGECYEKEKPVIAELVNRYLGEMVSRLPKRIKVYVEANGRSVGFTMTFTSRVIKNKAPFRVDQMFRKDKKK